MPLSTTLNNKLFISFEGCDGVGKSSQISLLSNYFHDLSIDHLCTREVDYSDDEGRKIKDLLIHYQLQPWTQLRLVMSARYEHLFHKIIPALNKPIICDRFIDSTAVYQAYCLGKPIQKIYTMHQEMVFDLYQNLLIDNPYKIDLEFIHTQCIKDYLLPDLTIILDLSLEESLARLSKTQKKLDFFEKNHELQLKAREGYLKLAKTNKARFFVIQADFLTETEVHLMIIDRIKKISNVFYLD